MRAGSNWRHLNGLSLGMMGDPVRCLPKVVHPDVAALKLQHNRKMFPKNGSGVDAAGDCGAWELDERATKQSGHAERGWVYKGPDAGGQHGNFGS